MQNKKHDYTDIHRFVDNAEQIDSMNLDDVISNEVRLFGRVRNLNPLHIGTFTYFFIDTNYKNPLLKNVYTNVKFTESQIYFTDNTLVSFLLKRNNNGKLYAFFVCLCVVV